jgi:hypothetical protein
MPKALLREVEKFIEYEKNIKSIKGEDFNLFSIMKMESNEIYTHSAVISELLNPRGSHHMEDLFLKLFLEMIYPLTLPKLGKEGCIKGIEAFLSRNVRVHTEYNLGKKNNHLRTGGRIDLLLQSGNENITIENKIFAEDQEFQLERYYNFNKGRNKVFYLTLFGNEATADSCGNLSNENYTCISYSIHIKYWLEECLKYTANQPILRESLKQYILLIKKLTYQMDDTTTKELQKTIMANLEASRMIFKNYEATTDVIKDNFRSFVAEKFIPLAEKYNLEVAIGNSINSKFAQIWLEPKNTINPIAKFGIESFSGNEKAHHNGGMMIGIVLSNANADIAKEINPDCEEWFWWPVWELLQTAAGNDLNLQSVNLLEKLTKEDFRESQTKIILKKMEKLIEQYIEVVRAVNVKNCSVILEEQV